MNRQPLLKIYGHLYPADAALFAALEEACATALPDGDDVPLLERDGDLVRLSFEGSYFPLEEVLAVVKAHLKPEHCGKIDVLDMEAWRLVRHTFADGHTQCRSGSLNQVLEYSGH
ncbi:MAG: hypothetical protein J5861_02720 [Desulfovibrio sp.]|nr:hypothetical protein [Desulfovibrio sp.]